MWGMISGQAWSWHRCRRDECIAAHIPVVHLDNGMFSFNHLILRDGPKSRGYLHSISRNLAVVL